MKTELLKHKDINRERWDACVGSAKNSLIYARSWYLDIVSPGWEALVYGDYEAVMPLTRKSKLGIKYLAQPNFAQQLGVFGRDIDTELLRLFIDKMCEHYRFAEIHLNYLNPYPEARERTNFVLNLNRSYEEILKGYSAENRKNLSKGSKRGASLTQQLTISDVIRFFRAAYGEQNAQLGDQDYQRFEILAAELQRKGMLGLYGVHDAGGVLCSACCFVNDGKRAVYVMGAADSKGRHLQATHFLLDAFIEKHAGTDLILDFEGSEIPGVNHFYRKFGPENQPFYQLKINNLPFPLKLLKR